jgi:hypothetical protein
LRLIRKAIKTLDALNHYRYDHDITKEPTMTDPATVRAVRLAEKLTGLRVWIDETPPHYQDERHVVTLRYAGSGTPVRVRIDGPWCESDGWGLEAACENLILEQLQPAADRGEAWSADLAVARWRAAERAIEARGEVAA